MESNLSPWRELLFLHLEDDDNDNDDDDDENEDEDDHDPVCNFRAKLVYLVLLENLEFQDFRECQEREALLDHQAPKATQ